MKPKDGSIVRTKEHEVPQDQPWTATCKEFRSNATREGKTDASFAAAIHLVAGGGSDMIVNGL